MKIGQMFSKNLSELADYYQVDICGKTIQDITYNANKPIILHGDWEKKGYSSNDIMNTTRQLEIIEICNFYKDMARGITIHPPTKKVKPIDFFNVIDTIQNKIEIPIFIENRSNPRFIISDIYSILNIPKDFNITIDIPQLFIRNNYDINILKEHINTLSKINNIKEIHLGGVKNKRVAQKLPDNLIDYSEFKDFLKDKFITLEVLGGKNIFEESREIILNL